MIEQRHKNAHEKGIRKFYILQKNIQMNMKINGNTNTCHREKAMVM